MKAPASSPFYKLEGVCVSFFNAVHCNTHWYILTSSQGMYFQARPNLGNKTLGDSS